MQINTNFQNLIYLKPRSNKNNSNPISFKSSVTFNYLNDPANYVEKYVFNPNFDIEDKNADGQNILHCIADDDKIDHFDNLTRFFPDLKSIVNVQDRFGKTPLHLVNSEKMGTSLIKHGADIKIADNEGYLPIDFRLGNYLLNAYNVHNKTSLKPEDLRKNVVKPVETTSKREFGEPLKQGEKVNVASTTISFFDESEEIVTNTDQTTAAVIEVIEQKITKPIKTGREDTLKFDEFMPREELMPGDPIGFADVIGMQIIKDDLNRTVVLPLKKEIFEKLRNNDTDLPNGILLFGPPGNGKSHIVKALVAESGLPLYELGSSTNEEQLKGVFDQLYKKYVETEERSILFLDEADSLAPDRTKYGISPATNALLKILNNSSKKGVIVLAATNIKDSLDEALLRPGRMDKHLEVENPDYETRQLLLQRFFSNKPVLTELNNEEIINEVAMKTAGFNIAGVKYIVDETVRVVVVDGKEKADKQDILEQLTKYSQEQKIPKITDNSKTGMYDKKYKRAEIGPDDPKSFDDIAGMEQVKESLKDNIIDPWTPEIMEAIKKNNISMPKGALLYGPPGNGKTFIMKAIAGELNLPLYVINMGDIGTSFIHDTSKNLKEVFDQLENKYKKTGEASILFLDEFEAVASKRDNASESKTEEIDTLLQLMNEAAAKGIIVVGATNFFDKIDPAVKRAGRLDAHIFVGKPDLEERKALIQKVLESSEIGKELAGDEEKLNEFAEISNDLNRSDISTIIRNSFIKKIKKPNEKSLSEFVFEEFERFEEQSTDSTLVTQANGNGLTMKKNKTTDKYDTFVKRDFISANDPQNLNDIGGMEQVKQELRDSIVTPSDPDVKKLMDENGIKMPSGIILHGPPGCGKTYIMKALAGEVNLPLYSVNMGDVGTSFIHDTSKNLKEVFEQLRNKYKKTGEASILFLDELEGIAKSRASSFHAHDTEEVDTLLQLINNCRDDGIIVVGATNDLDKVDDAIKRTGRLGNHIYVGKPDLEARIDVVKKVLRKAKSAQDLLQQEIEVRQIAERTNDFTNSDIAEVLNSALIKTINSKKEILTVKDICQEIEKFRLKKEAATRKSKKLNLLG